MTSTNKPRSYPDHEYTNDAPVSKEVKSRVRSWAGATTLAMLGVLWGGGTIINKYIFADQEEARKAAVQNRITRAEQKERDKTAYAAMQQEPRKEFDIDIFNAKIQEARGESIATALHADERDKPNQ